MAHQPGAGLRGAIELSKRTTHTINTVFPYQKSTLTLNRAKRGDTMVVGRR
jgi:hypothetical protein